MHVHLKSGNGMRDPEQSSPDPDVAPEIGARGIRPPPEEIERTDDESSYYKSESSVRGCEAHGFRSGAMVRERCRERSKTNSGNCDRGVSCDTPSPIRVRQSVRASLLYTEPINRPIA